MVSSGTLLSRVVVLDRIYVVDIGLTVSEPPVEHEQRPNSSTFIVYVQYMGTHQHIQKLLPT